MIILYSRFGLMFLISRYVSILTLVRVRTEQKGLYTVLISNGDDTKEVTFDLEVQGKGSFLIIHWVLCYYLFCSPGFETLVIKIKDRLCFHPCQQ